VTFSEADYRHVRGEQGQVDDGSALGGVDCHNRKSTRPVLWNRYYQQTSNPP
jgi:hypothetical protein